MPVMNLPSIKPPALGENSQAGKLGRDFPDIIRGGRLPENTDESRERKMCGKTLYLLIQFGQVGKIFA